jgi:hypothetical protein
VSHGTLPWAWLDGDGGGQNSRPAGELGVGGELSVPDLNVKGIDAKLTSLKELEYDAVVQILRVNIAEPTQRSERGRDYGCQRYTGVNWWEQAP